MTLYYIIYGLVSTPQGYVIVDIAKSKVGGVFTGFGYLEKGGLVTLLTEVSMHINESGENYQVGQNGNHDKAEVGLPDDCSEHYQEKSDIT